MNLPSDREIRKIQQEAAKIVQERREEMERRAQKQKQIWEEFTKPLKEHNKEAGFKTSSGKKGSSPYKQKI